MGESITASAIVGFAQRFEDESSEFYNKMAKKYENERELFLRFVREGTKNRILITRTYQETISDALEACFSFEDFNPNDYSTELDVNKNMSYSDALKKAIELEENASEFYLKIAECSESLLATMPRTFRKVGEKRSARKFKLKQLLDDTSR